MLRPQKSLKTTLFADMFSPRRLYQFANERIFPFLRESIILPGLMYLIASLKGFWKIYKVEFALSLESKCDTTGS